MYRHNTHCFVWNTMHRHHTPYADHMPHVQTPYTISIHHNQCTSRDLDVQTPYTIQWTYMTPYTMYIHPCTDTMYIHHAQYTDMDLHV